MIHDKVDRELGILTWEGEIDIAPETLYSDATKTPLPDWMIPDESPANESFRPTIASFKIKKA